MKHPASPARAIPDIWKLARSGDLRGGAESGAHRITRPRIRRFHA
jgi:hypothetical protein